MIDAPGEFGAAIDRNPSNPRRFLNHAGRDYISRSFGVRCVLAALFTRIATSLVSESDNDVADDFEDSTEEARRRVLKAARGRAAHHILAHGIQCQPPKPPLRRARKLRLWLRRAGLC
jgi:hypothetical protein